QVPLLLGTPVRLPLPVLKVAQLGRLTMEKRGVPLVRAVVGEKLYQELVRMLVRGEPVMVGPLALPPPLPPPALLPSLPGAVGEAVMEKAGRLALPLLLVTVMRMLDQVPLLVGTPVSLPLLA